MSLITNRRSLIAGAGAALMLGVPGRAFAAPLTGFTHGVASGDPAQTAVTLWTRHVATGASTLKLEIAEDESFARVVLRGETEASPLADHCAHARATGLKPGRTYFYRFLAPDGSASVVGRTRTLPAFGGADRFRLAVFSCSNITSGWFNAYAHASARDDIDLALHTGDYIYESPVTRPDAAPGLAQQRGAAPAGEIVALGEYRQRYASYRADPDLAELHRRLPMIAVWDDHETANNSWRDGASAHDPAREGAWAARKAAGIRAWREWLPMNEAWYDRYQIGDLATLFTAETRLLGRSQQLDDTLEAILAAGDSSTAAQLAAFKSGALADSSRSMMGPGQERWLDDGLKASVASGARWQIIAQQVIMGPTRFPEVGPGWFAGGIPPEVEADLAMRRRLTAAGLPYSYDKWDGYPAARQRFYDSARRSGADIVTLTGDSHNAWAFDLADDAGPIGVEFAGQSVSSFGLERRFTGSPQQIAADFIAANPALKWMDASQRGYMVLDITRDRIETEYVFVPAAGGRSSVESGRRKLVVERGSRRLAV